MKLIRPNRMFKREKEQVIFEVLVYKKGVWHTEEYSIAKTFEERAKELGLLSERMKQGKGFFHWYVMESNFYKDFIGGVFKPSHYTQDGEYTYAHLEGSEVPEFRIKTYLFEMIPNKDE